MTAATALRPSLRQVVLDALDDGYWYRRGLVDDCRDCEKQPAGICGDHQADNETAAEYDEARKQIEQSPGDAEVLAVLGSMNGGMDHDDTY